VVPALIESRDGAGAVLVAPAVSAVQIVEVIVGDAGIGAARGGEERFEKGAPSGEVPGAPAIASRRRAQEQMARDRAEGDLPFQLLRLRIEAAHVDHRAEPSAVLRR